MVDVLGWEAVKTMTPSQGFQEAEHPEWESQVLPGPGCCKAPQWGRGRVCWEAV